MEEKPMFPINIDKCPNCGSTRRIANEVLEIEKEKGKIGPKVVSFLFQHQSLITDPAKTVLSAPIIMSFFDVCVDCGTVYCIHAEVKTAMPGQTPGGPAGQGFSTS